MVTVVQSNENGSYWRKIFRKKLVWMKEVRRVKTVKMWAADLLGMEDKRGKRRCELMGTIYYDHGRDTKDDQRAEADCPQHALGGMGGGEDGSGTPLPGSSGGCHGPRLDLKVNPGRSVVALGTVY